MAAGRHLGFLAYLEKVVFFIQELYHAAYQCWVIYAHLVKVLFLFYMKPLQNIAYSRWPPIQDGCWSPSWIFCLFRKCFLFHTGVISCSTSMLSYLRPFSKSFIFLYEASSKHSLIQYGDQFKMAANWKHFFEKSLYLFFFLIHIKQILLGKN